MTKAKALVPQTALTLMTGVVVATGALLAALLTVGPVVRHLFGNPVDFDQDYTSRGAYWQCISVQEVPLGSAFLAFGFLFTAWQGGHPLRWALWAANPAKPDVKDDKEKEKP